MRISAAGGAQMRWRGDGRELFYLSLVGQLMAVPIRSSSDRRMLEPGEPVRLFTARVGDVVPRLNKSGYVLAYMVSPDGQRFLMNTVVD